MLYLCSLGSGTIIAMEIDDNEKAVGKWVNDQSRRIRGSVFDLEGAAFGELALSSSGLGEDVLAVVAGHEGLGVAEDHGSLVAASAFDVHEVGVGGGHEPFEFVAQLLGLEGGVEEVSVHVLAKNIKNILYSDPLNPPLNKQIL